MEPAKASGIWKYKTCCSKAGKVIAELELPKNVYSPGERVFGTITVNNRHKKTITELVSYINNISKVLTNLYNNIGIS